MLIGVGNDLQAIGELAAREGLSEPGIFFTEDELAYVARARLPQQTMAALFSAKEAFFKAVPDAGGGFWTDIEIAHDAHRKPFFRLHGALLRTFEEQGWSALLSISHSGDYVSTVVIVAARGQSAHNVDDAAARSALPAAP